jgi:hypothetical protein
VPPSERGHVDRDLNEPRRADRHLRVIRQTQDAEQALVEFTEVALRYLGRRLREDEESQHDAEGGQEHDGLLAGEPADGETKGLGGCVRHCSSSPDEPSRRATPLNPAYVLLASGSVGRRGRGTLSPR